MQQKSKFEKIFLIASASTLLASMFLISLIPLVNITIPKFILDLFLILAILAVGCITCLPAVKMILKDRKNIFAYIIFGLTGLLCLLWIIFIFVGNSVINAVLDYSISMAHVASIINYTKIAIFFTIFISLANNILINLHHFKKNMFTIQIIKYVSNFIVCLWLGIVILSLSIEGESVAFTAKWLLDSAFFATLFSIALVVSSFATTKMRRAKRREKRELLKQAKLAQNTQELQQANEKNAELNNAQTANAETNNQTQKQEKYDPWSQE